MLRNFDFRKKSIEKTIDMNNLKVLFLLKEPKSKVDTWVLMRVSIHKVFSFKISTKVKVYSKDWDKENQCLKKQVSFAKHYKVLFDNYRDIVETTYIDFISTKQKFSVKDFQERIKQKMFNDTFIEKRDLFAYFQEFINEKTKLLSKGTINIYKKIYNHLQLFCTQNKASTNIHEIDNKFLIDYEIFCRSRNPLYLENETVNGETKTIKVFLKWANEKEYTDNQEYKKHKYLKVIEKTIVFLTESELLDLWNFDLTDKPEYQYIRDVFVLTFLIDGIRFSDLANLKKANIDNNVISYIEQKTKQRKTTSVPAIATELLKKIIENNQHPAQRKQDRNKVIKQITDQYFNREIKKICKLVGIDKPVVIRKMYGNEVVEEFVPKYDEISHKVARKTFASLLGNAGMTDDRIIKLTGHKSIEVLRASYKNVDLEKINVEKDNILNLIFNLHP